MYNEEYATASLDKLIALLDAPCTIEELRSAVQNLAYKLRKTRKDVASLGNGYES